MRYGLLAGIRWCVPMLKSHRSLCVSFSRTGARLCIYHLLVWSNLNFLHIYQWITLPTQSCLALYFFCANLLHSLIMWLIVSSLSPHSIHFLFCCVLSILAFQTSFKWRVFPEVWVTSQVSRSLRDILADFNSAMVWSVSILSQMSRFPILFKFLRTVPRGMTTIGITTVV